MRETAGGRIVGVMLLVYGCALAFATVLEMTGVFSISKELVPQSQAFHYSFSEEPNWTLYTPYSSISLPFGVPSFALPFGLILMAIGVAVFRGLGWGVPVGILFTGFATFLPFGSIGTWLFACNLFFVGMLVVVLMERSGLFGGKRGSGSISEKASED